MKTINYVLFCALCVWFTIAFTGCAGSPMERQRNDIKDCVKEMVGEGASTDGAFEMCRQLYRFRKLKE